MVNSIDYTPGTIRKVIMKNFMTYDNVEFIPGPNLNLIVGPNGTGKSTIVCALCFGCGGTPKALGRSTSMAEYVKHGKEVASVQVEIQMKNMKTALSELRIDRKGSHEYRFDGKKVSRTRLREILRQYKIDVDNLCQFLAQDRVVEFARQTNQQLLENTEKAAGADDLFDLHEQLKGCTSQRDRLQEQQQTIQEKSDRLMAKIRQLQPEVDKAELQRERQEKLTQLRQKRAWLEYESAKNELPNMENQLNQEKNQVDQLSKELNKIEAETTRLLDQFEGKTRTLKEKREATMQHLVSATTYKEKFDAEKEKVFTITMEIEKAEREFSARQANIAKVERIVANLRQQFEMASSRNEETEAKLANTKNNLREHQGALDNLESLRRDKQCDATQIETQLNAITHQLSSSSDRQNQKLLSLRRFNVNAFQAYQYYEQNKEQFKGGVFLPFLSVTVTESKFAKFVEAVVPRREWSMFLFENYDDLRKFTDVVEKQLRLKVSVACVADQSGAEKAVLNESLRQMGFFDLVANFLSGPPQVTNYLVNVSKLNTIPVGTAAVEANLERCMPAIQSSVRSFLTENKKFSIRSSKYSSNVSVTDNTISEASIICHQSSDSNDELVEELTERKRILDAQLNELNRYLENVSQDIKEKERRREQLRQEITTLDQSNNEKSVLENQIRVKIVSIENLRKRMPNLDLIRPRVEQQLRTNSQNLETLLGKSIDETKKASEGTSQQLTATLECACAKQEVNNLRQKWNEAKHQFEQRKKTYQQLRTEMESAVEEISVLLKNAERVFNCELNRDRGVSLPDRFTTIFQSLPNTLEDVDVEIEDNEARLATREDVYAEAIDESERIKKFLSVESARLNEIEKELGHLHGSTVEKRERWLVEIRKLIHSINNNFSEYLKILGCAGHVQLDTGVDENDFSLYGLKIMVGFRDDGSKSLQELTPQRQSGGERSLVTMLYLLSLQQLSHMPFRCVDEINQGMDTSNERIAFDFLTDLLSRATRTHGAPTQYFMLTPKLQPGLTFNDLMTLHIIENGPRMECSGLIDFSLIDLS